MRLVSVIVLASASPALAHPGHVAEAAGHAHWVALAAVVAAGVIMATLAKRRPSEDEGEGAEGDAEPKA